MDGHEIRTAMCNEARAAFKDAGLSYHDLTLPRIHALRDIVDRHLRDSKLIKDFQAEKKVTLKFTPSGLHGEITCKAYYFDKREAVCFNPNGFIAFAGWADHINVVPVVSAFREWITFVVAEKQAAEPKVLLDLPWRREPLRVNILAR